MSNIKITKYFNYKPRLNGVFLRDNLPRTDDGMSVINLDNKRSKGKDWVSLFTDRNVDVYLNSFGIEFVPEEVLNKIKQKSMIQSIFRIQDDDSIMCGF